MSRSKTISMSPRTWLASIHAQNAASATANPRTSAIVNASCADTKDQREISRDP
jgi:hypothetical protein